MPYQAPQDRESSFRTVVDGVAVRWVTTTLPNQRDYYLQAWAEDAPQIEVVHAYRHDEELPNVTRARVFAEVAATALKETP
jgi:hypothetical protein